MTSLVAVCPPAPALVPDLTGRASTVLDGVRRAAQQAVGALVSGRPDCIAVVAAGSPGEAPGPEAGGTLAPFGVAVRAGGPELVLGPGHTIGAWLLDEAGWDGRRVYARDVPAAAEAVLVMANGSARRSPAAPGHLDERAEAFDRAIEESLADGDAAALAALDLGLADELMCAGPPILAALGRAYTGRDVAGRVLYADAPLGVGYWVALWDAGP